MCYNRYIKDNYGKILEYEEIIKIEKSKIISNPFNKHVSVVVLWDREDYPLQIENLGLNIEKYPNSGNGARFSLQYKDKPYLILEPKIKNFMTLLKSKINKESNVFAQNKGLWTILHELGHGSEYQLNDKKGLQNIKDYEEKYGSNTNVHLKNEIHADMLATLMMVNHLNQVDFKEFSQNILDYRKKSTSDNHCTFPALAWIQENSSTIYKKVKSNPDIIHGIAEKMAINTTGYDFGLFKQKGFPYNLNTSLLKAGSSKSIIDNYIQDMNKEILSPDNKKRKMLKKT